MTTIEGIFTDFDHLLYDPNDIGSWKLRSIDQINSEHLYKCHDIAHYFETRLKDVKGVSDIKLYYMNGVGFEHTLVTYMHNKCYYIIEGSWWGDTGIHGPFIDIDAMFDYIITVYPLTYHNGDNPDIQIYIYEHNDVPEGTSHDEYVKLAKGKLLYPLPPKSEFHDVHNFNSPIAVVFFDMPRAVEYLQKLCNENKISNCIFQSDFHTLTIESSFMKMFNETFTTDQCILVSAYKFCYFAKLIASKHPENIQVISIDDCTKESVKSTALIHEITSVPGHECRLRVIDNEYHLVYGNGEFNHQYPIPAKIIFDTFIVLNTKNDNSIP